jgi:hypothetical protein
MTGPTSTVLAWARWPEPGDGDPPPVAGFVVSAFNPLVAAVADRCLRRRHGRRPAPARPGADTAVVLVSASGDRASAEHVGRVVAAGERPGPLLFFQSVPNSVVGHVAARWGLGGPVVCLCPVAAADAAEPVVDAHADAHAEAHAGPRGGSRAARARAVARAVAREEADLLLRGGEADEVLLIRVEQPAGAARAAAVALLLGRGGGHEA